MSKRPIRHRAQCPGCGYPHVITDQHGAGHLGIWIIQPHNAPGGGLCSGSGAMAEPPPAPPAKGPGPNTEGKVTVSGGIEFIPWPKIARLANETMVITEKIDGTNACIQFRPPALEDDIGGRKMGYEFAAQSRTRLITPTSDNFGFAAWVYENVDSLFADLGYGVHFGEFAGAGIRRRYDLPHKVFYLFNTHRWDAKRGHFQTPNLDVVPLLHIGPLDPDDIMAWNETLRAEGSLATERYTGKRFANPEGVVAYCTQSKCSYKVTDAKAGPEKHAQGS